MTFTLAALAPPVNIAGHYTLTFIADSTCVGLPDDVRIRSYAGTITPDVSPGIPAGTGFRNIHEAEVRIRPEALEALAAEKGRVLERSFPLLESALADRGGNGDGAGATATPSAPPATPKAAPSSLDALLGNAGGGESIDDLD